MWRDGGWKWGGCSDVMNTKHMRSVCDIMQFLYAHGGFADMLHVRCLGGDARISVYMLWSTYPNRRRLVSHFARGTDVALSINR